MDETAPSHHDSVFSQLKECIVSTKPEPQPQGDLHVLEQTRRQINQLVEEISRLSDAQLTPQQYYAEYLQRVLTAIAAPAGAIWGRSPQGNLVLQYQIKMREVGVDQSDQARECHLELLRQAAHQGRELLVPPQSGAKGVEGKAAPANLTRYVILLAPIILDKQVAGLLEVWQEPDRPPAAQRGFLQFIVKMTEFASAYIRNLQLKQMLGQQHLWTQLEAFARQIHGSLNPREVGYLIANEGRRLIDCDRVSVALRLGSHTKIQAVSGADVIEKRSSLIQTMRKLFNEVLVWGEKLVYSGVKDDSLPPRVLHALDAYLAESSSKLLIVLPLRDEREPDKNRPARSALMMECFETAGAIEPLSNRLEVVSRHAAPAMYNAAEHRRIPFRWALMPLAKIKDGLRGRKLTMTLAVLGAIALLIGTLVFTPYELRMDAKGQLTPKVRQTVYAPVEGKIVAVPAKHGQRVNKAEVLLYLEDANRSIRMEKLQQNISGRDARIAYLSNQIAKTHDAAERRKLELDQIAERTARNTDDAELKILQGQTRDPARTPVVAPMAGWVVTFDLHDRLMNMTVKPDVPLMKVVDLKGAWEIEIDIPEGNVGRIKEALANNGGDPLNVDILLLSRPDRSYKGKLYGGDLGGETTLNAEKQPILRARVQLTGDLSRAELDKMPVGAETRVMIHCGKRSIGYVWFYELWEFFYERVLF